MLAGVLVALALGAAAADAARASGCSPRPGVLFGFSYLCLFEAYFRGRVSVVSPLVATESLWGVGLAALVFRGSERIGRAARARRGRDRRRRAS